MGKKSSRVDRSSVDTPCVAIMDKDKVTPNELYKAARGVNLVELKKGLVESYHDHDIDNFCITIHPRGLIQSTTQCVYSSHSYTSDSRDADLMRGNGSFSTKCPDTCKKGCCKCGDDM
jgi:hypothetical protein